ncbi:hypothetical protein AAKU55_005128 [Oxalobacteraceae bacterium GrIS 1.11]
MAFKLLNRVLIFFGMSIVIVSSAYAEDIDSTQTKQVSKAISDSIQAVSPSTIDDGILIDKSIDVEEPRNLPGTAATTSFFSNSKFELLFRNYSEYLRIKDSASRQAWVQGVQAGFQSGFTEGSIGVAVDATLFGALKLDGGKGARNMVRVGPGDAPNQSTWAYLGGYGVKVRSPGVLIKYGLQTVFNPFLDPYDIRALPPKFRGVSLTSEPSTNLSIQAGRFDAVVARGTTSVQSLATSYGGIDVDHFSYLGADWVYAKDGKLSLYVSQAKDVWNQYYMSTSKSIGDPKAIRWTGRADIYGTREQGKMKQDLIDNKSYSLSLNAQHQASSILLGYQRIYGNSFFDFIQETSGMYLSNSMGTDFNAPHEQSIQLRYKLDGYTLGLKGFRSEFWGIFGWGTDGSAEASRHSSATSKLHDLYWRADKPIQGGHEEYGSKLTYAMQGGCLQGVQISLLLIAHNMTPNYPSKSFRDFRLMIDIPLKVF